MTSSMLAGERRWATARRGGMTVLGKVAVPKPLNLPSQKLENHGLDPNVEIVPKGSLSWGSRPSSSTSNPWGSSAISPNAESSTVSPRHPSGRPSSGGGLSRPSTAGSDRMHEPSASTWGPNSRPSSASGVLTSNQSSLTSSRPLSAETRPGSSHLSRFAEPVFDNSVAWGPNGTADKLSIPSKVNDFSLSSGDFPTLGSKKDDAAKSSEAHDHGSHGRPGSASGRTLPAKERNEISQADPKSGTVDTWTREGSPRVVDGVHPNAEKWQGEPQHYVNPNVPPQHFDAWRGPPMNAPPGVWYRGPPAGPPYPPVPHGGFPMEPFPYYRPQMPPALVSSQPGPPPGPGPRGHHPRNGDFYRQQMPDAFIRPGMPRPGFYPGPVPYDGYFGPPMGYNPTDRDIPFMGMPPGPPVYNMCPSQNPSELNDGHFRPGGRGSVGNMFVSEQPEESRGPYKVLRKRENERDADMEEESWEQTAAANSLGLEKSNQPRPSFHRNERGTDARRNEDMPSRRNTLIENQSSRMPHNQGYPSDSVIVHSPEGTRKSKASNESWGKKSEIVAPSFPEVPQDIPANPKDSSLIQKIEGLNAKVRASDVRGDAASGSIKEEQKNRLLVNPKDNSTIAFGSTSNTGDLAPPRDINVLRGENTFRSTTASASPFSRQAHHGVRSRADHHIKGRSNNQDNDGWRKKPPILGFEGPDNHISAEAAENPETKNAGESLTPMVDPTDGQAQRARMRELAKQRAIQLQKEEEERIREQKAKSLAKLEELNRRTLAADGTTQAAEKTAINVSEQEDVEGFQKPTGSAIDTSKQEIPSSDLDAKAQAVAPIGEKSTSGVGQSITLSRDSKSTNSQQEPVVSHGQSLLSKQNVDNATDAESKAAPLGNDGSLPRQKRVNHRQKQSVQMVESSADKPTLSGTSETLKGSAGAVIKNPGSNVAVSGEDVPSQESSLPNNSNILSESTQQRKRNNKSSKTKHKLDDASPPATTVSSSSASREGDLGKLSTESGKPESSQFAVDPSTVLVTDSKDAMQSNLEQISSLPTEEAHGRTTNQYKPQHSRRMPRNPQANRSADRFHGSDGVMWAPVRAQSKEERVDEHSQRTMDAMPLPTKSNNLVQTNLKSKRAEMERYVPKPVAKELAQQGGIQQSSSPSSPRINTSEDITDREELGSQPAIPVSAGVGSVVESKSGDIKQNKQQVKSHGAWRQRGPTEVHREQQGPSMTSNPKKPHNKTPSQHEASSPVPSETNIMHEWDPSDGWFMPEYPPTEVAPAVGKDEGAATGNGKGKRPAYKGQRSTAKNHDVDHKDVSGAEVEKNLMMQSTMPLEINQTDRPTSSKENRWQPKPQAYNRGGWSSGGQNASSEVKRVQPEEPVAEYKNATHDGHQEGRRERKPFRGPNQGFGGGNMEDDASSGFRKYGGQNNRSGGGQDNRRQNNNNANINRERQRQNLHYEYQPVGSNNNNNSNRSSNPDAPADGSGNAAASLRYKERGGSGESRRGGGNLYGRQ